MQALIIIDMQDYFFDDLDQLDELNAKIVEQIREYREERKPIVLVEYRDNPFDPDDKRCGPTSQPIKEALEGYRYLAVFGKDDDDGSEYLENYVEVRMDGIDELVLVGVNLDCCVISTAKGLARNHPDKQVTILEECCASNSYETAGAGYEATVIHTQKRVDNVTCNNNLRMLVNQRD